MAESLSHDAVPVTGPLSAAISRACAVLALLGGLLFVLQALMSVASVVGRSLFSLPVPGDFELVQMTSAMGIAMCLPYCQLQKGHVFVDFFTLWAPDGLKRWLDALATLLLAAVSFLVAWRTGVGMLEMREYGESSMVLALPIWWGYLPLVPSFALLGVAALLTLVQESRGGAVAHLSGEEQP